MKIPVFGLTADCEFVDVRESEGRRNERRAPFKVSFEASSCDEGISVLCSASDNNGSHIINGFPSPSHNGALLRNPMGDFPNLTDFRVIVVDTVAADTGAAPNGTAFLTLQDMGGLKAQAQLAHGASLIFPRKNKFAFTSSSVLALQFSPGANLACVVTIVGHGPVVVSS